MRVAAAVLVIVAAMSVAAAEDARDDVKTERARTTVLDDDYQKVRPLDGDGGGGGAGSDDSAHQRDDRRDPRFDTRDTRDLDSSPMGSSLISILMWAGIFVVVALGALWLGTELMKYGGDAELADEPAAVADEPNLAVIERPLADAEEHAKRGEYREAIHVLLLRTLRELARSAAVRVSPALTSREILGRVPLLADAREALGDLIVAVEITHFGEGEATAADYARCRAQFDRFAKAFRGGGSVIA